MSKKALIDKNCPHCSFKRFCFIKERLESLNLDCPCWECVVRILCNDYHVIRTCPYRRKLLDIIWYYNGKY